MSGGANKALLANPKDWLAKNILIIEINPTAAATSNFVKNSTTVLNQKKTSKYISEGKVITVDIEKAEDTATNGSGQVAGVYKVKRGSALPGITSNRFKAFYLPWGQNDKKLMTLDEAGVDWFFTDTMNGCSFAAGPGAQPKVGHFNYQVNNTAIDAGKIDHEVGMEFSGGAHHRLDKAGYMDQHGMNKVTTLGFRENGQWNFYYQVREIVSLIPPRWKLVSGPNSVSRRR